MKKLLLNVFCAFARKLRQAAGTAEAGDRGTSGPGSGIRHRPAQPSRDLLLCGLPSRAGASPCPLMVDRTTRVRFPFTVVNHAARSPQFEFRCNRKVNEKINRNQH